MQLARCLAPVRDLGETEFGAPDIQDGIRLLEALHLSVDRPRNWREWASLIEAAGLNPFDPLETVFVSPE